MSAHVEMVMGVIRWGKGLSKYGDPYEFAASVVIRDGVAEIIGAAGVSHLPAFNDVRRALHSLGAQFVEWERKSEDGSTRKIRVRTIPAK